MASTPVPFLSGIDLHKTELRNAKIQNLTADPASPALGQVYFNTVAEMMRFWNGDIWVPMTGVNFRRAYSAVTDYYTGDAVTYSGSTYIMRADAPAGTLPTDTDFWDILAEGGMMATYTNSTPMPVALGGYAAGTTFNARSNNDMWTGFLYPYQSPAFSGFTMSGQATTVEAGTTLSGSKTFSWSVSNAANVKPGSVSLYHGSSGGTLLASGLSGAGSTTVTIPTVTNNSPTSQTYTLVGQNTNNVNFSTTFVVTWQYKKYYGISADTTLDSTGILALASNSMGVNASGNYAFAAGEYKYIAVPAAWTAPSAIKDQATLLGVDLATTAPYTNTANSLTFALVNVTNALGVTTSYRVYRSKNKLGAAITFVVS